MIRTSWFIEVEEGYGGWVCQNSLLMKLQIVKTLECLVSTWSQPTSHLESLDNSHARQPVATTWKSII